MSEKDERHQSKRLPEVYSIPLSTEVQPPSVVGEQDDLEVPSDFEEAVDAAGYGLYNVLLLFAVLPGGLANTLDTTTMSYVLPAAECDLNLTLFDKGVLNAVTYVGMMSSAFIWGFLANTKGRRILLMSGYLADGICKMTLVMGYTIPGTLVHLVGTKVLLLVAYAVSAAFIFGLNWSPNSDLTLAIVAVYLALTSIAVTTIISVIVNLMPTALRAMAVSLNMCIGRSGAAVGNLLFPILPSIGCMVPFTCIGGFLVVCFILCIFIPKPPATLK